jgi:molecular chaperone DnaK
VGYRLGVDLGTTYTAAAVNVDGRIEMLGLGIRAMQVPSVVFIRDDGEVIVGEAAEQQGAADPSRLVREFKRRIGDAVPLIIGGSRRGRRRTGARPRSSVRCAPMSSRAVHRRPPRRSAVDA